MDVTVMIMVGVCRSQLRCSCCKYAYETTGITGYHAQLLYITQIMYSHKLYKVSYYVEVFLPHFSD